MYYILFYKTAEDYIEKRKPYREQHLAYANEAHKRGELLFAGALAEPSDSAVLIFKCDSPQIIEDFVKNDIYVHNGVVVDWNIHQWNVVVGN
jgi:hypothetical protein